ncbi:MAG: SRPBCC family protein [Longimicrobiales bacterium]
MSETARDETGEARDERDGTLERVAGRWRLRFVRVLRHPPERVWRALTEESQLAAWFPTTIEGDFAPGGALRFRFRGEEMPPSTGEMIACEPPRLLEFTWGFTAEGDAQPEHCRFELSPEGRGCRLTFTTTYDQVGKSARDAAGWHVCFDLLEAELAGEPRSGSSPERWKPLNRRYAERFGPEAATIGPPDAMQEYQ